MNWFPVFSSLAVVIVPFLGLDHPGRTILTQVVIVVATLIGLGLSWRKQAKAVSGATAFVQGDAPARVVVTSYATSGAQSSAA
jgi:hypothetical protein